MTASAPGIWPLISNKFGGHTNASGYAGNSYGQEYKKSGWIKTNNGTMPTQRHNNGDIDLRDMRDGNHIEVYRGSFSGGSKEEILSERHHNDSGIRKTTQVEFSVTSN